MQQPYFHYGPIHQTTNQSGAHLSQPSASCGLHLGCLRVWLCGQMLYDLSKDGVMTWLWANVKLNRSDLLQQTKERQKN